MASGYTSNGIDLDALFMARSGAARANVGYQVGGVDLAQRYEQIGSGTPIAATGFQTSGTDLANLFRNISEPLGGIALAAMTCSAITAGSTANAQYILKATGDIYGTNGTNSVLDRGDWIAPKSGMSLYQAQGTLLSGPPPSGAAMGTWWALSADVGWGYSQSAVGLTTITFEVRIRRTSDSALMAGPVTITLTSRRNS